jgi:hypothetical protein
MGPIGCPETSVTDYQSTLRNIPEKRRCQMLLCVCTGEQTHSTGLLTLIHVDRKGKGKVIPLHARCGPEGG